MATCPKCNAKLPTKSQVLFYHNITCPTCASNLEVTTKTRLIGALTIIPLFVFIFLLNFAYPISEATPLLILIAGGIDFLIIAVVITKFATFKLSNNQAPTKNYAPPIVCANCNQLNDRNAKFCTRCGTKLA